VVVVSFYRSEESVFDNNEKYKKKQLNQWCAYSSLIIA